MSRLGVDACPIIRRSQVFDSRACEFASQSRSHPCGRVECSAGGHGPAGLRCTERHFRIRGRDLDLRLRT
eukprot:2289679-Pleurochrysis_carterae.AAC.1